MKELVWDKDFINKIICGDVLIELKKFPDESIDMVITSPPYYGLRNYCVEGQLGLESIFDCGKSGKMKLKKNLTKKERNYVLRELGLL